MRWMAVAFGIKLVLMLIKYALPYPEARACVPRLLHSARIK
jgi:hypothetical protein